MVILFLRTHGAAATFHTTLSAASTRLSRSVQLSNGTYALCFCFAGGNRVYSREGEKGREEVGRKPL